MKTKKTNNKIGFFFIVKGVKLEGEQGFSRQNYLILNVLPTWYQNYFPLKDILTNPIPHSEKHNKQQGRERHLF